METSSRIFKVVVAFQEKDEVFYTRIKTVNGVQASLFNIVCARYPSLATLIKRCYVNDTSGAEFSIINSDDLAVFLEAEELFENVVRVEINGVNRETAETTPPKRVRIEDVQATPATLVDPNGEDKEEHQGVVCDCCDQGIFGFRYKCTECFNFDLCMTCEGKMRHREHIMIRIPTPTASAFSGCTRESRRFSKKHPEAAQAGPENDKSSHGRRYHSKRHQRRCQRGANLFDGFFRQMTEDSPASDVETCGAATNTSQTEATPNQQQAGQQEHATRANQQPNLPPMYDFHKLVKVVEAVAGNVSKLFDPHGMSLETYADYGVNIPPTATVPPTATTPTAAAAASSTTPVNVTVQNNQTGEKVINEKQKEATATETTTATNKQSEDSMIVLNKEATPDTSSVPEPFIMDVIDDTSNQSYVIQPTTDAVPMSPPSPVNISSASDDAEWMVISREGMPEGGSLQEQQDNKATQVSPRKESVASTSAQTTVAASTETSAQTQGYDELAKKLQQDIEDQLRLNLSTAGTQTTSSSSASIKTPIVYHPVPHINLSIIRMMDMGFSNDGGCLTELMACCNGDIRRALDSLLYNKK